MTYTQEYYRSKAGKTQGKDFENDNHKGAAEDGKSAEYNR